MTRSACLATTLVFCAAAAGASQRAIVTDDLDVRPISKLLALADNAIEIEESSSRIRRFDAAEILGVTQTEERAVRPAPSFGWIELVDGQRYVGRHAERASEDESIAWDHREFGVLWIPLEFVSRVSPTGVEAGVPHEEPITDTVYLNNGDILEGYILSAGSEYRVEGDDGEIRVAPADRVSIASFANPPSEREGVYLWTVDGSVLAAESVIDLTGERVQVQLVSGESAALRVPDILGAAFAVERFVPLASLEARESLPDSRRWARRPAAEPPPGTLDAPLLFAPDVVIPGAMTVRWSLPVDAARFSTTISMPESAFPWGDCEVVVSCSGSEIARVRLNQTTPSAVVNEELASPELTIEVLEGENGSVHDRVRLLAPLVLLER